MCYNTSYGSDAMKKVKDIELCSSDGKILGVTNLEHANELRDLGYGTFNGDTKLIINVKKVKVTKPSKLSRIGIPSYTLSEELMSAISHGLGTLISIAICVLCVVLSALHHNPYAVVASALYGGTSIILYTMSTLYHSFKINNAKRVFRIIDHCSIYLLIAGTYTPYALVTLREASTALGWSVFGVIWGCAAIGITFTAIDMNKFKVPGMILYLIMGWMIIFTFKSLLANIEFNGILFMLIAGVTYTIGAIFYGIGKKKKYMHSVFHFFVLAASVLFFFSILFYVI